MFYSNWLKVFFLVLLCNIPTAWAASHQASTPQVQAELVSSAQQVVAGETITLGVHLKIIPHWHTYWQNPGDSGTVTTIDWQFSRPSEVSDILWPIPTRFRLGPIVNYGYENTVTLPVKVKVAADAKIGEKFKATAIVDWLVCKEECIPQQVTLTLDLPVVAAIYQQSTNNPSLDEASSRQPQNTAWKLKLETVKDGVELHIPSANLPAEAIQDIWFYPYQWEKSPKVLSRLKSLIQMASN